MCCYYNHVQRVYCIPTIPQIAYAAGIAIYLCYFQGSCRYSSAVRPCCFPPLSHRDALIIYPNNQRVDTFFANFSTFFITFLSAIIGARHRQISEHIFDNSLSITAYQYSDIDRFILIKSYRYNYIDTGVSIRGV